MFESLRQRGSGSSSAWSSDYCFLVSFAEDRDRSAAWRGLHAVWCNTWNYR